MLEITNASFFYEGAENLFENINIRLEKGDIVSILGPNGTGKTTFIKCILGFLKFRNGEMHLSENSKEQIGYVPQSHYLNAPYTSLEMVLMGRAKFIGNFSSPGKKDIEIAKKMLKTVGVEKLENRFFNSLSGGERQLILIARALASECSVLVLDEPTSALDFNNQYRTLNMIKEMAEEFKLYVIFTTHQPEHAMYLSCKTLLMGGKDFSCFGKTDEVINERNLKKIYGLKTKIVEIKHENGISKTVIPIMG